MPRLQKVSEKVFAEIAETPQKKGAYTTFLDIDKILNLPESEALMEFKEMYKEIVTEHKEVITALATIEEIIIQFRCKSMIDSELRLSLSRNYIYARSIFYRRGNQINDIRVVIGTTDTYGDNLGNLMKDVGFRAECKLKLLEAMDKEINKNVVELKTLAKV
jgi:hypothetical protein